ncbi:hypothetical protein [Fusibacter sp. 3D3]|uniref:hypothetical protein n=1 Tax=Fusibacter sp. 3D3 TaxID=1048380 RepID=UPI000852C253|nr:hypothetical protein [Fusibacter sp. 3D3]GAU75867.1 hypothetical protein F3D3_0463 [Fusibacter sp. 3D3]
MKKKRTISMLLILMLIFSNLSMATESVKNELSEELDFSMTLDEMSSEPSIGVDRTSGSSINQSRSEKGQFDLKLEKGTNEESKVTGTVIINGESYSVEATGEVLLYDVLSEADFSKGVFTGHVYDRNGKAEEVIFDLSYDEKNKRMAASSMTIGVLTDTSEDPIMLSFGTIDVELNNAFYEKYILNNNTSRHDSIDESKMIAPSAQVVETSNYQLQASGNNRNLVYLAGFHAPQAEAGDPTKMWIRSWTNKTNINNYFASQFNTPFLPNSVAVTESYLTIENQSYWQSFDQLPSNNITIFNMVLPLVTSNGALRFLTLPITTYSTKCNPAGSPFANKVDWVFKKAMGTYWNTDANSSSPWYESNNGFGAESLFTYQASISGNIYKYANFSGGFNCSAVTNNGIYTTKYLKITHSIGSSILVTP